jgi:aspartate 1-decarboxylase
MNKAGIIEFEKVLVCDITNGNRWETYAIEGKENSGKVEVQGAGANLCKRGDIVIILSFEITDEPPKPKIVLVNQKNEFEKYL